MRSSNLVTSSAIALINLDIPSLQGFRVQADPAGSGDVQDLSIHAPEVPEKEKKPAEKVAWDSNLLTMDGYGLETGWVKIDTRRLASIRVSSFSEEASYSRATSR